MDNLKAFALKTLQSVMVAGRQNRLVVTETLLSLWILCRYVTMVFSYANAIL